MVVARCIFSHLLILLQWPLLCCSQPMSLSTYPKPTTSQYYLWLLSEALSVSSIQLLAFPRSCSFIFSCYLSTMVLLPLSLSFILLFFTMLSSWELFVYSYYMKPRAFSLAVSMKANNSVLGCGVFVLFFGDANLVSFGLFCIVMLVRYWIIDK